MGPRARVLLGVVLLLANASAACATWRVQAVSPQELLTRSHPTVIRVWEPGKTVYALDNPRLDGDSLAGYVLGAPHRVPLVGVERVAVRKFNPLRTVWWSLGFPVLALGALLGVACAGGGCNMSFGSFGGY